MTRDTAKQQPPITFRDAGIEAQIAMRTPAGESRNQTAKEALDRYFKIMTYEAGDTNISAREWVALKAATSDHRFQADTPPMFGMKVYDGFQAGKLSVDWDDASVQEFMDKLENLPRARQWAVIDLLEKWRVTGD